MEFSIIFNSPCSKWKRTVNTVKSKCSWRPRSRCVEIV